jgi:hypothetical protein
MSPVPEGLRASRTTSPPRPRAPRDRRPRCIRFKRLEDLKLEAAAELVKRGGFAM